MRIWYTFRCTFLVELISFIQSDPFDFAYKNISQSPELSISLKKRFPFGFLFPWQCLKSDADSTGQVLSPSLCSLFCPECVWQSLVLLLLMRKMMWIYLDRDSQLLSTLKHPINELSKCSMGAGGADRFNSCQEEHLPVRGRDEGLYLEAVHPQLATEQSRTLPG